MATQLLVDWWNERAEDLDGRILISDDPQDASFQWGQLVWQELRMWEKLGKRVSDKDLALIVHRRGFSADQKTFLVEGLTYLGLYGEGITRMDMLMEHE